MANLSDLLFLGGDMPLVLTVGVGYPVGSDIDYVFERRAKDLVNPTGQEGPGHDGVAHSSCASSGRSCVRGSANDLMSLRTEPCEAILFPGDSHLTAAVVATTHGMRWVFS